jgi:hypothetical protein
MHDETENQPALAALNAETFRAENRDREDWEPFLRGLLADGFVLRRAGSAKPDEQAEQVVDAIRIDRRRRALLESTVRVWESTTLGVVASVAEIENPDTPESRYFQNVKIFERDEAGSWRLTYWQVTGKPHP